MWREGKPLPGRVRRLPPEFGLGDSKFEELEGGSEGPRAHPSHAWVIERNKRAGEDMSPGDHCPCRDTLTTSGGWLKRIWYSKKSPWPEASANQRQRH